VQACGELKRELTACLRTGRALRVPRARARQARDGFITADVTIANRPPEAADRAVPGHWEGDLIIGLERSAIGTLVERTRGSPCCFTCPAKRGTGSSRQSRTDPPFPAMAQDRCAKQSVNHHDPARAAEKVDHLGPRNGDGAARDFED
jgi:hypothetical protein